jgi:hypothetical protein
LFDCKEGYHLPVMDIHAKVRSCHWLIVKNDTKDTGPVCGYGQLLLFEGLSNEVPNISLP